jgi:acylphosphatase
MSFKKTMEVGAHIVVHGRVQGVGFRYFVSSTARTLGITGYACNRADGTVEVLAEGDRAAIDELLQALRNGPRHAHVTDVEVAWSDGSRRYHDFEIR